MSAATAPNETSSGFAEDEHVIDEIERGGSPAGRQVEVDGSPANADGAGATPGDDGAAGDQPAQQAQAGAVPAAWLEEKRELESKLAQSQAIFAELQGMAKADPVLAEKLGFGGGEASAAGWRGEVDKLLGDPDGGLDAPSRKAVMKGLDPLFRKLESMERELSTLRPQVGRIAQTTAQAQFRQGLAARKVPLDNPQFQKVLAGLRRDPEFQSLEARGSDLAVRAAASEWFAQSGRAASNRDGQVALAAAKGGRNGATRSGALAERIVELTGDQDEQFMQAIKLREEADKNGQPWPKIKYSF